jgi:hypothetical protein
MLKSALAVLALISLSGCIAIPRIDIPETLTFDYELPSQQPMNYSDLLCCYECQA